MPPASLIKAVFGRRGLYAPRFAGAYCLHRAAAPVIDQRRVPNRDTTTHWDDASGRTCCPGQRYLETRSFVFAQSRSSNGSP